MNRIASLDLARGFTVLFIPAIHSVMVYSNARVHSSWLGNILAFIAEGPGAQLFMLIMGVVFTFKERHDPRQILLRSTLLFTAGCLLNILKFVFLYAVGAMPYGLMQELQINTVHNPAFQLTMMGDILHFSAIATLVMYSVYSSRYYPFVSIILSIIIILISPHVWDSHHHNGFFQYLINLLTGHPPTVYFPAFPWLIYPLIGLAIGLYIKKIEDKTYCYSSIIGIILLLAGWLILVFTKQYSSVGFYRTYPGETIIHIGIVLMWMSAWHWISKKIPANRFFHLLSYCSRNITSLYIIQWLLISWMLPFIGYHVLGIRSSMIVMILTTLLTFSISLLFCHFKKRS
jgi:hypothetical protein